jgi:hypothetical protein
MADSIRSGRERGFPPEKRSARRKPGDDWPNEGRLVVEEFVGDAYLALS